MQSGIDFRQTRKYKLQEKAATTVMVPNLEGGSVSSNYINTLHPAFYSPRCARTHKREAVAIYLRCEGVPARNGWPDDLRSCLSSDPVHGSSFAVIARRTSSAGFFAPTFCMILP